MYSSLYLLNVKFLANFSYCAFVVVNDVSKFSGKVPKTHIDILNKIQVYSQDYAWVFLGACSTNSFETIHILVSQKKLQFLFPKVFHMWFPKFQLIHPKSHIKSPKIKWISGHMQIIFSNHMEWSYGISSQGTMSIEGAQTCPKLLEQNNNINITWSFISPIVFNH